MREMLIALAQVAAALFCIFSFGLGLGYVYERAQCHAKAAEMKLEAQYGFLTECLVKRNGRWELLPRYKWD
jgi:hypothetical protein